MADSTKGVVRTVSFGAVGFGALFVYLQRRYSRTVPTFGPGMVMHDVYQEANPPLEPIPNEFTLTIDYEDAHDRHYTDSYELSVITLHDHTRTESGDNDPPDLQRRTTCAVEAVARAIGRR
jgi:hypothetical protein